MLFSLDKQFLFVHVPKAAGSSLRSSLENYCVNPRRYWINRALEAVGVRANRFGPFPRNRFRLHDPIRTARRWLPPRVFDGLFKFAFVRNPWDRMVSMYAYILARPDHHRHRLVASQPSFDDYVQMEIDRRLTSQLYYLTDDEGRLLVDFVGRFENLHDDFAHVRTLLGLACRLGHRNGTPHAPYQEHYTPKSRDLVARYFAAEIERFGYEFDARPVPSAVQAPRSHGASANEKAALTASFATGLPPTST